MANNEPLKRWSYVGPLIAVSGIIFGAGGMAYTTCDRLAKHETSIAILTDKTASMEIVTARIDERLKSIDESVRRIESRFQGRGLEYRGKVDE